MTALLLDPLGQSLLRQLSDAAQDVVYTYLKLWSGQ